MLNVPQQCAQCKNTIFYKTFAGFRVWHEDRKGRRLFETTCGCGKVQRLADGRRAKVAKS